MLISSLNSLLGVTEAPLPTSASGISRDKASETSLNEAFSLDLSPAARKAGQAASAEKNTSLIVKAKNVEVQRREVQKQISRFCFRTVSIRLPKSSLHMKAAKFP